MTEIVAPFKPEPSDAASLAVRKGILNHQKTAEHLERAAHFHRESAKFHENGQHEKAALSTVSAMGHVYMAVEAQREDIKNHIPQV